MEKSKLVVILTFVVVIVLSPASVIFSFLTGLSPEKWLGIWLRYVFFFILSALLVALAGLSFALYLNSKKKVKNT